MMRALQRGPPDPQPLGLPARVARVLHGDSGMPVDRTGGTVSFDALQARVGDGERRVAESLFMLCGMVSATLGIGIK